MRGTGFRQRNSMATASLILGILSIICVVSVSYIYYAIVFGCLGMLFAVLSRGGGYSIRGKAVGGLATSAVGTVLALVIIVFSVWFAISLFGLETFMDPDALTEALESFYEEYYDLLGITGGTAL